MSFEQDLMFFNEMYLKQGVKGGLFKVWKYFLVAPLSLGCQFQTSTCFLFQCVLQ
jgi:hypothetical protein